MSVGFSLETVDRMVVKIGMVILCLEMDISWRLI